MLKVEWTLSVGSMMDTGMLFLSDEFGKEALKGIIGILHQIRRNTIEGAAIVRGTIAASSNVLSLTMCLRPVKGITLSAELVREWINAFLITSNVYNRIN